MRDSSHSIATAIHLYEEGDLEGLDLKEVAKTLTERAQIPCFLRGNPYHRVSSEIVEAIATEFARSKIIDPTKRWVPREPLRGECDYERRRIRDPRWKLFGILYDGLLYQRILWRVIPREEQSPTICIILFTNQLFGTWDWDDRRYHARVSLYGFPSLISTTGLVEAPAKPKEFYIKKQMGVPLEMLKDEYRGRFIDHGDERLTELMKGYAFQAVFFHLFGEPFCEDPCCRLFNGHWQEEVLGAQLGGTYEFCPRHEELLNSVRNGRR